MSEPADERADEQELGDALIDAWDEMSASGEVETGDEPDAPADEDGEEVAAEEAEEVAGEEDTTEEADEEEVEEEEEEAQGEPQEAEPVSFSTDDPAILAYLARYDNDPSKALKAAVELQRVLTRQGTEKNQALARVAELEAELQQAQLFQGGGPSWLTEEQREYVSAAVGSEQPLAYVRQAVDAGEYDLARAITEEWATEAPFPAMRAAQLVDNAEAVAMQYNAEPQQPAGFTQPELFDILVQHFPEMPRYEAQMVAALRNLGDNHPLVVGAHSNDAEEAARSIIGLYEIARASSVSAASTRVKLKEKAQQDAVDARHAAAVSSGQAAPQGQTPRKVMIAPGLSLEDLDAALAEHQ